MSYIDRTSYNNELSTLCMYSIFGLIPLGLGLFFLISSLTMTKKVTTHVTSYADYIENDNGCYFGYPIYTILHNGKNYTSCSNSDYGAGCGCSFNVDEIYKCLQSQFPIGSSKSFYVNSNDYTQCSDKSDNTFFIVIGIFFLIYWMIGCSGVISDYMQLKPPVERLILLRNIDNYTNNMELHPDDIDATL